MNKKLSTREAFEAIVNDREVYKTLSSSGKNTMRSYRLRVADGARISTDKMEEIIQRHGGVKVQITLWKI